MYMSPDSSDFHMKHSTEDIILHHRHAISSPLHSSGTRQGVKQNPLEIVIFCRYILVLRFFTIWHSGFGAQIQYVPNIKLSFIRKWEEEYLLH